MTFKSSHEFILPALLLSFFGLMVILSQSTGDFQKQLAIIVIGILIFFIVSEVPHEILSRLAIPALLVLYLLLAATSLFGEATRGSARWLNLGILTFQPSEMSKPFLILALSWILGTGEISLKRVGLSLLVFLPAVGLIFTQPDLGTTLVVAFVWVVMVLFSGIKPLHATLLGGLGGVVSLVIYLFGLKGYQQARLRIFLNPESDPLGAGYNVLQSIIDIGSGRILGKGFGHGSQSQLNFLPESKTDFIFASLAEEWGFIGGSIVILLFFLASSGILRLYTKVGKRSAKLLCLGVWATLIFQTFVNIGMNLGIMPVTGIPLPFVSLGGSSILSFFIMMGALAGVAKEERVV